MLDLFQDPAPQEVSCQTANITTIEKEGQTHITSKEKETQTTVPTNTTASQTEPATVAEKKGAHAAPTYDSSMDMWEASFKAYFMELRKQEKYLTVADTNKHLVPPGLSSDFVTACGWRDGCSCSLHYQEWGRHDRCPIKIRKKTREIGPRNGPTKTVEEIIEDLKDIHNKALNRLT